MSQRDARRLNLTQCSRRLALIAESLEERRLLAAHVVGSATSYATIQAAVDAAASGGTVTVERDGVSTTLSAGERQAFL